MQDLYILIDCATPTAIDRRLPAYNLTLEDLRSQ